MIVYASEEDSSACLYNGFAMLSGQCCVVMHHRRHQRESVSIFGVQQDIPVQGTESV